MGSNQRTRLARIGRTASVRTGFEETSEENLEDGGNGKQQEEVSAFDGGVEGESELVSGGGGDGFWGRRV